jgi:putative Ca2+/H+ antiporter (TMEM165/GDT1 family)
MLSFLLKCLTTAAAATVAVTVAACIIQQNPWGVALGSSAAYAAASGLAVLGGAWAAQHVSEQTLDAINGLLFLLFAAASLVSMF